MGKKRYFLSLTGRRFLLLLALVSCQALAEDAHSMNLQQLTQELRAQNPQFMQAEQGRLQIAAQIPQALAWDRPMVGMEQTPIPHGNLSRSQGTSYRLTQTMSFPGKKQLAADILQSQADSAGAQIDGLYVQLLAQLKTQYYQLLALQKQEQINQDTIARLEQLKQVAKVRYANNAAAFVDYMNAQVAQGSAENDIFQTRRQIAVAQQSINSLIGRNPVQPLLVQAQETGELDLRPLFELLDEAQGRHPALRDSAFQLEAAQKNVALAKKAYYPDMQLILTKISDHPPYGMAGNAYGLEVDLVLPTWFFQSEKAGVNAANAGMISAQAGTEVAWRQVQLEIANAYSQVQQVVSEKALLEQRRLPEARAAYRLALHSYANNAGDFNGLLLAQQNLRDTELAAAHIEGGLAQAIAALDASVGRGED